MGSGKHQTPSDPCPSTLPRPPKSSEEPDLGCDLVLENNAKENGVCQVFFYQDKPIFQLGSCTIYIISSFQC